MTAVCCISNTVRQARPQLFRGFEHQLILAKALAIIYYLAGLLFLFLIYRCCLFAFVIPFYQDPMVPTNPICHPGYTRERGLAAVAPIQESACWGGPVQQNRMCPTTFLQIIVGFYIRVTPAPICSCLKNGGEVKPSVWWWQPQSKIS